MQRKSSHDLHLVTDMEKGISTPDSLPIYFSIDCWIFYLLFQRWFEISHDEVYESTMRLLKAFPWAFFINWTIVFHVLSAEENCETKSVLNASETWSETLTRRIQLLERAARTLFFLSRKFGCKCSANTTFRSHLQNSHFHHIFATQTTTKTPPSFIRRRYLPHRFRRRLHGNVRSIVRYFRLNAMRMRCVGMWNVHPKNCRPLYIRKDRTETVPFAINSMVTEQQQEVWI